MAHRTFFTIKAVTRECNATVGVMAFNLPYHITESFGAARRYICLYTTKLSNMEKEGMNKKDLRR